MNTTPENKNLIPLRDFDRNLWQRIKDATSQPEIYFAPTIGSILEERYTVLKTRGRIYNPGLMYNGGIVIYLPTAYFRWREPFRNFEEVSSFIDNGEREYQRKMDQIMADPGHSSESMLSQNQVDREMAIPSLEVGRLYDGITELPICPTEFHGKNLSNGQKLFDVWIGYKPYCIFGKEMFTSLLSYQDHSNISTADRAAKPSLADVLRGMVPQLEPSF